MEYKIGEPVVTSNIWDSVKKWRKIFYKTSNTLVEITFAMIVPISLGNAKGYISIQIEKSVANNPFYERLTAITECGKF